MLIMEQDLWTGIWARGDVRTHSMVVLKMKPWHFLSPNVIFNEACDMKWGVVLSSAETGTVDFATAILLRSFIVKLTM